MRLGRALRHRNYRLFFTGQVVSLTGTQLTRFATIWMVFRLTHHSAAMLGVVAFVSQAPTSLIAPIAGVLVDRWDRRRVVIGTQVAAMLQSAALAVLALGGWITVWHLMALGMVQSVINAFDLPARQSFMGQMIDDRADLPNAIALNSSMVNGARLIGPVLAAAVVGLVGEGWCFAIDAVSYLAVIATLSMMRVAKRPPPERVGRVWTDMQDGWRYAAGAPLVRGVLLLMAATCTFAGSYQTLLPLVAPDVHELGFLMGAGGLGALAGALYLANRSSVLGLGGVIARCSFVLGAGLIALGFAPTIWLQLPVVFVIGFALMVQLASTNTILQTIVEPGMLGRVLSLYAVAFFAGAPVGALIEGSLAQHVGARTTFVLAGVIGLGCAYAFRRALPGLRAVTRPLYVRLGLIEDSS